MGIRVLNLSILYYSLYFVFSSNLQIIQLCLNIKTCLKIVWDKGLLIYISWLVDYIFVKFLATFGYTNEIKTPKHISCGYESLLIS